MKNVSRRDFLKLTSSAAITLLLGTGIKKCIKEVKDKKKDSIDYLELSKYYLVKNGENVDILTFECNENLIYQKNTLEIIDENIYENKEGSYSSEEVTDYYQESDNYISMIEYLMNINYKKDNYTAEDIENIKYEYSNKKTYRK